MAIPFIAALAAMAGKAAVAKGATAVAAKGASAMSVGSTAASAKGASVAGASAVAGGSKGGAGALDMSQTMTRMQSAIAEHQGAADPTVAPIRSTSSNSSAASHESAMDLMRLESIKKRNIQMAENPRATGFAAGGSSVRVGKQYTESAVSKQQSRKPSRLKLRGLSL